MRAWVLFGTFLVGCGGAVPSFTPADLAAPRMQGLKPRTMSIKVADRRPVSAEERWATEQNLAQAFREVFGREGVKVAADSPNVLAVTLALPSTGVSDMEPQSCVEMAGELRLGDGRWMTAKALGCAELKNAFGMSYGGRVSAAFQYAADTLLKSLDEGYASANTSLVFDSARIEVPKLLDLGVNTLGLTVKDEFSEDGSSGQNLAEELRVALVEAGVKVDETSAQTLVVTLSHPTQNFAGRDKTTCMAIELKASLQRATVFGHSTACRGLAETMHHKALNEALEALSTEYARLIRK